MLYRMGEGWEEGMWGRDGRRGPRGGGVGRQEKEGGGGRLQQGQEHS